MVGLPYNRRLISLDKMAGSELDGSHGRGGEGAFHGCGKAVVALDLWQGLESLTLFLQEGELLVLLGKDLLGEVGQLHQDEVGHSQVTVHPLLVASELGQQLQLPLRELPGLPLLLLMLR